MNGDLGASTLINTSTVGMINFNGDVGADQFLNQGNNINSIVFGGGSDANVFVNTGAYIQTITYQEAQTPTSFQTRALTSIRSPSTAISAQTRW